MVDDQRLYEVKSATLQNFGALWVSNFEANRGRISRSCGVASLFERFPNFPALAVGAGPSLDKNLPWLKSASGKAVIICVDTILAGVMEEGIDPSFVVTLDPQPEIARFFLGVDTSRKTLIAPTISHPATIEAWKGDIVFYNKFAPDIPQLTRIASVFPDLGYLIPGGSVLTVGLDLAFRMGSDPIGFIGQDLSYPPGMAYSSRTLYGGRGVEQLFKERMDTMVTDTDIFGREVTTQKSLFVTKQWMEWAFSTWRRKLPARFYNLTEGGIVSRHCGIMPLREWILRFCLDSRNIPWEIKKALQRKRR